MKSYGIIFSAVFLAFFLSCSSSQHLVDQNKESSAKVVDTGYDQVLAKDANQSNAMVEPNKERRSNMSLDDMMRRLPGVQVSGSGPTARIKVQGAESFMANTDPLFVLNGTAIGTDYARLYSVINPNEITSLSVLKGSDAAIYGTRGANGVILIRTKIQ